MKKTLITILALAGMAAAETTILTFKDYPYDTDNWNVNGLGKGANNGGWSGTKTLSDNTVAGISITDGKLWNYATTSSVWTNALALQTMNSELGTSFTSTDLNDIEYVASAAGGARSSFTLNFANNAKYEVGSEVVFYLLVATSSQGGNTATYGNFSVTGLDNAAVTWAAATGDGFSTTAISGVPVENLAMIRVEGNLTEQTVGFAADAAKNGWAMVSYAPIPEPTTATLSLLALAGLAARRRRASR